MKARWSWLVLAVLPGCENEVAGVAEANRADISVPQEDQAELKKRIRALEAAAPLRIPLEVNSTGNEICSEHGLVCLDVFDSSSSLRADARGVACGHAEFSCNSRYTAVRCTGAPDGNIVAPVTFHRSPNLKGHCAPVWHETCEKSPLVALCIDVGKQMQP